MYLDGSRFFRLFKKECPISKQNFIRLNKIFGVPPRYVNTLFDSRENLAGTLNTAMLQISRGNRDNLGIIFHISLLKCILCLVQMVLMRDHNICFH